jgi:hypothetical protein
MVESTIQRYEEVLRFRANRYLNDQKRGSELKNALRKLELQGCSTYLVGGFLRDLMLDGPSAKPRDIDIVFDGVSPDEVELLFWNHKERKNRFGGMRLNVGQCPLDVWSLQDTWAFRHKKVHQGGVSAFPRTTFLNVDAIAFRWKNDSEGEIFSEGFFEGILNRTLEINLEENPFPETCVVRSLMMASALHFGIGPKLAGYILRYSKNISIKELQHIQKAHYGFVRLDGEDLRICFDTINAQLNRSKDATVFLPQHQQLKLDEESSVQKGNNARKSGSGSFFTKLAEALFVHTRPVRRLKHRIVRRDHSVLNVLNVRPHWFKKVA